MDSSRDHFSRLLPQLADRSRSAVLSRLGFAHVSLYRHLHDLFSRPYGQAGCFLADPTFEAVFGWEEGQKTMEDLAGSLLTEELVIAMDEPPNRDDERCPERDPAKRKAQHPYRFGMERKPYRHQIQAWEILAKEPPHSLIVASGTGSGKTESFMVPILDRLVRQQAKKRGRLVGVRALFLYPLNALINSQRERLRAWTHFSKGDIRFCLYNGNTLEEAKAEEKRRFPSEVLDRKSLRNSSPPILVTNATMLEYMLVRAVDAPILEQSQGKLEWVVLDEAHAYIGSQAAELALLIRRVLHAFGVTPEQVRFVATSATIGDSEGEAGQKLKRFLVDVAGVREERVHLVVGRREVPSLPQPHVGVQSLLTRKDLWELDAPAHPDEATPRRYAALAAHPKAWAIRQHFIDNERRNRELGGNGMVATLAEVCQTLFDGEAPFTHKKQQIEALRWLDLLSGTRDADRVAFLPLRAHLFHQTLSGIWACADPECPHREGTALADRTWPFGRLYLEPRQHCQCGSPVYELVACDDCGAPHLLAADRGRKLMQPLPPNALDEFELDVESSEEDEDAGASEGDEEQDTGREIKTLVVNRPCLPDSTGKEIIERQSRCHVERELKDETLRLTLRSDAGEGLTCPCCDGKGGRGRKLFQEARIGAPFALSFILPTLLEFAPDERCKPVELPYRGRRLLTFNDSRQGTARMAARLQQESERSRVRGLIYHLALREGTQRLTVEAENLKRDIEDDELILTDGSSLSPEGRDRKERSLKGKRERLAKLTNPKPIPFDDLARHLADQGQDFKRMWYHYRDDISRESFGGSEGGFSLARMFLVREFGRRPKRLNNLESMGLVAVQYPALEQARTRPDGFTPEEWHDFLKIALDFFVRSGGSLAIDKPLRQWLGMRIPRNWLVKWDRPERTKDERRWPRAANPGRKGNMLPNHRSLLVRLLARALNIDIETPYGEDQVNDALAVAWKVLTEESGILREELGGRRSLPLNALAFAPITQAWICPVTRRFLDTTLRGITPYLPRKGDNVVCAQRVDIPLYDCPFGGDDDPMTQITRARSWLARQPAIVESAKSGLWSPLNDRAIELAPYFTAAEHSAQQPSDRLQQYEDNFKKGELNLLSCSTTMEMGIDIGGISIVAMNNVPPHPANYLQRAGRAGRRQEARSLAFTLCKSNPHDQIVFAKTDWPFVTPLPAPMVALNSAVIVQRHINSMVLAHFLKAASAGSGQDTSKLTSGWFFTSLDDTTPAQRFIDRCQADAFKDQVLERGLRQLVRSTQYEGQDPVHLLRRVAEAMEEVKNRWTADWEALCRQEEATRTPGAAAPDWRQICRKDGNKEGDMANRAVRLQACRIRGEFLLRELANQGFLPAYGFPTHLAAFDNLTVQRLRQMKREQENGREDNRYRRRELANRDSVMALREYAPGAQVVMDGLVYRSAGITLNWKIPASESEAREPQAIKHAWHCHQCGASGAARTLEEAKHCNQCETEIKLSDDLSRSGHRTFIEPAGFAVDFYDDPHNDVSTQDFIPVEPPWVNADGGWLPLPNPTLGQFRVTTRGHIFHQSNGLHGKGYAICLECGRAEPMAGENGKPKGFEKPHKKLRGEKQDRKSQGQREDCPGSSSDWLIKTGISLGAESYTDVLEIQLANKDGVWLDDRTTGLTLAVALRDALAELLGVRADELSCDTKEVREEGMSKRRSILIFDRFAAGYASSAERFIDDLFHRARKRLHCHDDPSTGAGGCDSACPYCVLDFDQRFSAESLDRHKALQWITEDWLNALKLPAELAFFGNCSRPEYADIDAALLREARAPDLALIRLFGSGSGADLGTSPLRHLAYRLAGLDHPVEVVIDHDGLIGLEEGDRYLLASLSDHPQVRVVRAPALPGEGAGWVVAEIILTDDRAIRWGVAGRTAQLADAAWGSKRPLICGIGLRPLSLPSESLKAQQLRPQPLDQGDREISVQHELDGSLQGFGKRFWTLIGECHPATKALFSDTKAEVGAVVYHDRYLFTPLSVALLINLIEGLRDTLGRGRWADPKITVTTTRDPTPGEYRPARTVWSNWPDLAQRDAAIVDGFDYIGVRAGVTPLAKRDTAHGRILEIGFSPGVTLRVRFDQGVSYWQTRRSDSHGGATTFDFSADAVGQAEAVAKMSGHIAGGTHPTHLFVQMRYSRRT